MSKVKKFAHHKQINVDVLRDNSHVYPKVYDALNALDLIPFVTFSHPYNEDLVMQFFVAIYFGNDEARTMYWMSRN